MAMWESDIVSSQVCSALPHYLPSCCCSLSHQGHGTHIVAHSSQLDTRATSASFCMLLFLSLQSSSSGDCHPQNASEPSQSPPECSVQPVAGSLDSYPVPTYLLSCLCSESKHHHEAEQARASQLSASLPHD